MSFLSQQSYWRSMYLCFLGGQKIMVLLPFLHQPMYTGDVAPFWDRYCNIPPTLCQNVKYLLPNMLDSRSPWDVPIVLIRKKDGSLCFCWSSDIKCVDSSRYLPLDPVEELLISPGQACYFSTLDLASGHWQVPVRGDYELTALITPLGLSFWANQCSQYLPKSYVMVFWRTSSLIWSSSI